MPGTYNGSDFREGFDNSTGSYKNGGDASRAQQAAFADQRAQAEQNRARAAQSQQSQQTQPKRSPDIARPKGRVQSPKPQVMAPKLPGALAGISVPAGGVVPAVAAPRVGTMGARTSPTGYLTGGGFGGEVSPASTWGWGALRSQQPGVRPTTGGSLVAGSMVMPGARPGSIPDINDGLSMIKVNPTQPNAVLSGYKSVLSPGTQAPPPSTGGAYKIKAGDTLASIASRLGTSVADLKAQNNIKDVNQIYAGTTLNYGTAPSRTNSAVDAIGSATAGDLSGPEWDAYYAKVKGGANYFSSGKHGSGDTSNVVSVPYKTKSGKEYSLSVNPDAQEAFTGFLSDLEATGYDIQNLGSQVIRPKRSGNGMSEHSYGSAIDINGEIVEGESAPRNQYGKNLVTDLPPNVSQMAAKWGLSWGGDWNSVKDAMHFEYTGNKPFKKRS